MARPLRLIYPDTFYHVLNRGVEQRTVFEDKKDYLKFLALLEEMSEQFGLEVWSYVGMGNHYHLLLRTREVKLSEGMQWLGSTYSGYYNWRHGRSGTLFQGRFKGFQVEQGEYLERLILYIHRNPLRAGLVDRLVDYRWSSYRCLAYGRNCLPCLQRKKVIELFGGDEKTFRSEVKAYSDEGDRLLEDLKTGLYLGGESAWEALRRKLRGTVKSEIPQVRAAARSETLEAAAEAFRKELGLTDEELSDLLRPVRGSSRHLRDILHYFLWRRTRRSLKEIGEFLGVDYSTVSHARKRGQALLEERGNRNVRKAVLALLS